MLEIHYTSNAVTATVVPAASISGTITDANGSPIATKDICVQAASSDNGPGSGSAVTDASGNYQITGLVAGSYYVYASDCPTSSRNDVQTYYSTAPGGAHTAVAVADGAAQSGIDIQLLAGTAISGHVYGGAGTGTPVSGACVFTSTPPTPRINRVPGMRRAARTARTQSST